MTMGVNKQIKIHPKFQAKQYTIICVLNFCGISRSNRKADTVQHSRDITDVTHAKNVMCGHLIAGYMADAQLLRMWLMVAVVRTAH
jgi:hypothetical protein